MLKLNSIIIFNTAPRTCSTENRINNLAGNHNSNWNGSHVKPIDFTADSQSCWTFCWETYNTSYFTWTTYDNAIATWRSGCICKKGYLNPRVEAGYVSGIVCPSTSSPTITTDGLSNCTFEENISYTGTELNAGTDGPAQDDAESCRSFCKSNYPSATHFGWVTPSSDWIEGRKTCWCKTTIVGAESQQDIIAGVVNCEGRLVCPCEC